MSEYAAIVSAHPYYRALLGNKDGAMPALHNVILAGMHAVYRGCLPSNEQDMIRNIDAKLAFVRDMEV